MVDRGAVPVPGVVVQLIDADSSVVARALTDERGAFLVATLRPGTYRVRTLRIGWRPATSEPIVLAAAQEVSQNFELTGLALALDTVRIGTTSLCRLTGAAAATTFALWEQVRTALNATELTAGTRALNATTVMFQQVMDPATARTLESSAQLQSGTVAQPWNSLSADSIRKVGYVVMDGIAEVTYYAPGLDVLASDRFIDDHCFRIIGSPDPTRIGVAIEPTSGRSDVADIRGTIWLDRASSELRSIDFQYTNIPTEQAREARGLMEFARMADGSWAISRWSIRMPVVSRVSRPRNLGGTEMKVVEIRTVGGELAFARRGADTLWARNPFTVSGTLLDSASGRPVAGAQVSVEGTPRADSSRADGTFAIGGVLPGNYRLEVRTASLDSIGARHLVPFTLMLQDTTINTRVPEARQIVSSICRFSPARLGNAPPTGLVLGVVRSSDGDASALNAVIVAEWSTGADSGTRWVEARADMNGSFRLCGLPANTVIVLRAQTDRASATPIGVRIPDGGSFARAEMTLDRPVEGSAALSGTVVSDSTDQPIARVELVFPDLGKSTLTSEQGTFRVHDIPAGAHHLIVRRVGYGPLDTTLAFAPNQAVVRRVVLSRATELAAVTVVGASNLPVSFDENRKMGLGNFATRVELDRLGGRPLGQLFERFPGAAVPGGVGGAWVMATRIPPSLGGTGVYRPTPAERRSGMIAGCFAKVYVDNILMNPGNPSQPFNINSIRPEDVEAVEFYSSAAQTPIKYATLDSNCGVVVIWRRR